jgi:hypothetical protein
LLENVDSLLAVATKRRSRSHAEISDRLGSRSSAPVDFIAESAGEQRQICEPS